MKLPRLYPILDTASLEKLACSIEMAAEAMLAGGARILQFRHKGHFSRAWFEQAERVAALCRREGAIFVVDDRADIAMMLDAGLHVGQDDLPPSSARQIIGAERLLGFSTHNEVQLRAAAAEPIDYVALGPVFGTASKDRPDPVVGVEGLRRLRPLATRPLVAIGGITRENALTVLDAGADSVAVIGDLLPEKCDFESVSTRMGLWQQLVTT
jgi:thiamine-phosphate pyrophosphorylase